MFIINFIKNCFSRNFYLAAWVLIFVITMVVILLVQLLLLPYVFSDWHGSDGLLAGADSLVFHRTALEMAENINTAGWSEWELRPRGWMPAGVVAAIYTLTRPEPWVLAPLNAAVHATTALMMIKLLLFFVRDRQAALVSALPFIYFPSAMLWYTQIHRDGYNILGMLLFIYGVLLIVRVDGRSEEIRPGLNREQPEWAGFLYTLSGILLIWLARPHALIIFQYTGLVIFSLVALVLLFLAIRLKINWKPVLLKLILLSLILLIISPITGSAEADKYFRDLALIQTQKPGLLAAEVQSAEEVMWAGMALPPYYIWQAVANDQQDNRQEEHPWSRTSWLPSMVDSQLYSVAYLRTVEYQERYGDTASGIDYEVSFHSAYDFIGYLPRALQIAFLAPFPADWFGEGTYAATTFFRRVSAYEMTFIYFMLASLLYGFWIWRKKIELYVLLLFCTIMMLPIVYSVPNVGTIYRYRYGYLMLLVSIGVAALIEFGQKKASQKTGRGKTW